MDGYGNLSWWGFTPAFDLIPKDISGDELNILLVNSHDPRLILKTLSRIPENENRRMNFYVVEPFLEQLGRFMLLLSVAFEERFGLQETVENYMEIFGNTLIRKPNSDYIIEKANQFIKYVVDLDLMKDEFPMCDISSLKHKERDYLEGVFKFWRESSSDRSYEIHKIWDIRVRQFLGVRYDTKENAFDWDRIMKAHERGANIIHQYEYNSFRSKGLAFESRSGDYDVPNRTLSSPAAFTDKSGDKVIKRGYFGDIVTGPFMGFGIESENHDLFKKQNNMYMKMSTDVCTYNLTELFKKLRSFEDPAVESETILEEVEEFEKKSDVSKNLSVKLFHSKDLNHFLSKSKFSGFFDCVFFGCDSVNLFTKDATKLARKPCLIYTESPKYFLELKKEQVHTVLQTLLDNGKGFGLKSDDQIDEKDPFKLNRLSFIYS